MKSDISRRAVLRGAGVALALPWLESLAPRAARAQSSALPKRFIFVSFPCGVPEPFFWQPRTVGEGASWALSPILEPFANLKSKSIVVSGLENYSACGTDPQDEGQSHGRRPGSLLTCANVVDLQQQFPGEDVNGISIDQLIAHHPLYQGQTPLNSLELSLGTSDNSCDGPPCPYSRALSWKGSAGPNLPEIDPGAVFDRLVGAVAQEQAATPNSRVLQRRALNNSVLDAVEENIATVSARLGAADRAKMEEFLASVRGAEQRVLELGTGGRQSQCGSIMRPTMIAEFGMANTPDGYNKGKHADLMNDLMAMAFQCDSTRVITHLMEHERSEFIYNHVSKRVFTETTSTETGEPAGNYHGASAGSADEWASITRWNALKVAELCQRLDAIEDAPGVTALDNTVLILASCMDGGRHSGANLPVLLVGGLGGVLKTDQHIAFEALPGRPLRDLFFTLKYQGFGLGDADFGNCELGTPNSIITELLA